jgi:hypothetical protein
MDALFQTALVSDCASWPARLLQQTTDFPTVEASGLALKN